MRRFEKKSEMISADAVMRNGLVLTRFGRAVFIFQIFSAAAKACFVIFTLLFCLLALVVVYLNFIPFEAARFAPAMENLISERTQNRFKAKIANPVLALEGRHIIFASDQIVLTSKDHETQTLNAQNARFQLDPLALLKGEIVTKAVNIESLNLIILAGKLDNTTVFENFLANAIRKDGLSEFLDHIANVSYEAFLKHKSFGLEKGVIDKFSVKSTDGTVIASLEEVQVTTEQRDFESNRLFAELKSDPVVVFSAQVILTAIENSQQNCGHSCASKTQQNNDIRHFDGTGSFQSFSTNHANESLSFPVIATFGNGNNSSSDKTLDIALTLPDLANAQIPNDKLNLSLFGLDGEVDVMFHLPVNVDETTKGSQSANYFTTSGDGRLIFKPRNTEFRIARSFSGSFESEAISFILEKNTDRIELQPSVIKLGKSSGTFFGAIQLSANSQQAAKAGTPVFEFISNDLNLETDSIVEPVVFSQARLTGGFDTKARLVSLKTLEVVTPSGRVLGSGSMKLDSASPSLVFTAGFESLSMLHFQSIWPPFIAARVRQWVKANLSKGELKNGRVNAAIPAGILGNIKNGQRLAEEHLQVSVGVEGVEIKGYQDIPKLRTVSGTVKQIGMTTNIAMSKGLFWLQNGEQIKLDGSDIQIADFSKQPLSFDSQVKLSGDAKSIAYLAAGEPVQAFKGQPLKPDDFEGFLQADVAAQIFVKNGEVGVKDDWRSDIQFRDVDITRKFDGYSIKGSDLAISLNAQRIEVNGEANIDGQPAQVKLVEGLKGQGSKRSLTMVLDHNARKKFGVDLSGLLEGKIIANIDLNSDGTQSFDVDMTDATLTLPGIGWTKGAGIQGNATFNLRSQNGEQIVSGLQMSGGEMRAKGSLKARNGSLTSLNFTRFGLNKSDDSALNVVRKGDEYIITLSGNSFDLRPLLQKLVKERSSDQPVNNKQKLQIIGKLKRALGFNGEVLTDATFGVRGTSNTVSWMVFEAQSLSGARLNIGLQPNAGSGDQISLRAGDLGSLLRFGNIYSKVTTGSATAELVRASSNAPYVGAVRANNITIIGEARLSKLVNSRAGGERSLNETLKQKLPTEKFEFSELFTEVTAGRNFLRLNRGSIRGPFVGSTFEGAVYDAQNNMDVRGVFLPAYKINNLISSIPIIGDIFGNPDSGGFLGISWRLGGKFTKPKVEVNPISLFTPGLLREIFN